jgi:rhodanese-related sulfurtransferase
MSHATLAVVEAVRGNQKEAEAAFGRALVADPKAIARLADKTVVLYCDDGATTGAALRTLARAGIKNVLSLRGGLSAWKQENLPVVRG